MSKTYNTPKRSHLVKTRLNDEEYEILKTKLDTYGISQAEFLRRAINGAQIKPIVRANIVNDQLLTEIGRLTGEFGKIGSNLNQIARQLNQWRSPYPAMAKELRDSAVDLAMLKYEVLQKVGDSLGNVQAYQL